jgi:hypothetical protein
MMTFNYDPVLGLTYDFVECVSISLDLAAINLNISAEKFIALFREQGVTVVNSNTYSNTIVDVHSIYCNGVECNMPLEIELAVSSKHKPFTNEDLNRAMRLLDYQDLLEQKGVMGIDPYSDDADIKFVLNEYGGYETSAFERDCKVDEKFNDASFINQFQTIVRENYDKTGWWFEIRKFYGDVCYYVSSQEELRSSKFEADMAADFVLRNPEFKKRFQEQDFNNSLRNCFKEGIYGTDAVSQAGDLVRGYLHGKIESYD